MWTHPPSHSVQLHRVWLVRTLDCTYCIKPTHIRAYEIRIKVNYGKCTWGLKEGARVILLGTPSTFIFKYSRKQRLCRTGSCFRSRQASWITNPSPHCSLCIGSYEDVHYMFSHCDQTAEKTLKEKITCFGSVSGSHLSFTWGIRVAEIYDKGGC